MPRGSRLGDSEGALPYLQVVHDTALREWMDDPGDEKESAFAASLVRLAECELALGRDWDPRARLEEALELSLRPQDPAEALYFSWNPGGAPYSLKIKWYPPSTEPPADLDLTIFSFAHDFTEYPVAASSLMDPADAHGAFSVAAIDQANWTQPDPPAVFLDHPRVKREGRLVPRPTPR